MSTDPVPSFKTLKVLISSGSSSIAFSFVFPGGLPIKAVSQGRVLGNHQGDEILSQKEEYSLIFKNLDILIFNFCEVEIFARVILF